MNTLADMKVNEKAVVTKVNADEELKQRLCSFGVRKNTIIKVKNLGIAKSTMEIEIGSSQLALRIEEAKTLEVESL